MFENNKSVSQEMIKSTNTTVKNKLFFKKKYYSIKYDW